jgi:SAM-dependent methyltransferase
VTILKPARLPLVPAIVAREKLTRSERGREVGGEPAVMDEPQGAAEYDEFGTAGEIGIHHFSARAISRLLPEGGTLLDLGCGSGRLLARLARGRPDARVVGLDLSEPMLEMGRQTLEREGLAERVELRQGDITDFESEAPDEIDVVSCNFALHHLPDEGLARRCFEAIARTRASTGCGVWLFDFARLRNTKSWPAMVSLINWPGPVVHNDAIASEKAAFSAEEMTTMLEEAGLGDLAHARARPLGEYQAHWAPGRNRQFPNVGLWRDTPLPREIRLLATMVTRSFPRSLAQV